MLPLEGMVANRKPFKTLLVVIEKSKRDILSARIRQGTQLGTDLLWRNRMVDVQSAKNVVRQLLDKLACDIQFEVIS